MKKITKSILLVVSIVLPAICLAQKSGTYKCVATYNHGEPWPTENETFYIEFDKEGCTTYRLSDGEFKFPQRYEFERKSGSGTYEYRKGCEIMKNLWCWDYLSFSNDYTEYRKMYRCPESTYEFDWVFKKIK